MNRSNTISLVFPEGLNNKLEPHEECLVRNTLRQQVLQSFADLNKRQHYGGSMVFMHPS